MNEHEQTHSGQEHNDSDAAALTGLEDCVSKADAIIVKEAGTTGWWDEKVKLARDWGVTLYVVRRPQLPVWPEVTGPHGLRRAVEHAVPSFFPLHSGLTTGSCATAAAVEALLRRLGKDASERASILLPNGEEVSLPISRSEHGRASVVKDGGSDPDATHGCTVVAEVRFLTGSTDIVIEGGEGVGRVTMPGLGLPVGSAAINIVPQQMIRHNLRRHYHGGLHVTIAVPQGREIAQHTFNPRLGIVDGISIIGTTGIVRPFSNEAFVEAMRRQMQVAIAMGTNMLVLNSGLRSERAVRNIFANLPSASFVHYGNFIGDALKAAATLDIRHVALCVMLGKAVKLAAGNLNTHSHQVTMDRTLLAQWLEEAECDDAASVAATINMARELPDRLTKEQWQRLKQTITNKCIESCKNVYPYTLDFYLLES